MKKTLIIAASALCFLSAPAYSSLMDERFVVETSESDAEDGLNRIAGKLDNGFLSEDSTYRSVHHGRSGPFATHEDAYDVSSTY